MIQGIHRHLDQGLVQSVEALIDRVTRSIRLNPVRHGRIARWMVRTPVLCSIVIERDVRDRMNQIFDRNDWAVINLATARFEGRDVYHIMSLRLAQGPLYEAAWYGLRLRRRSSMDRCEVQIVKPGEPMQDTIGQLSWICCRCKESNVTQHETCRGCKHDRCDREVE